MPRRPGTCPIGLATAAERAGRSGRLGAAVRHPRHSRNLDWLADSLRSALLLDEVGRKMEPAYVLKEKHLLGEVTGDALMQSAQVRKNETPAIIPCCFPHGDDRARQPSD